MRCSSVLCIIPGPSHGKVVVCYVGSWAAYRSGQGAFSVDYVDPSLCTHLIYAFALLDEPNDGIKPAGERDSERIEDIKCKALYQQIPGKTW